MDLGVNHIEQKKGNVTPEKGRGFSLEAQPSLVLHKCLIY